MTAFLSDGKYIQFFWIQPGSDHPIQQIMETPVMELSGIGLQYLCGMLCTDPVDLGWKLPAFTFKGQPTSIVRMLGQGGSSIVYEAQSGSNALVVKQFRNGSQKQILENEESILKHIIGCSNVPQLMEAQRENLILILTPVGQHFASDMNSHFTAHMDSTKCFLTAPLAQQLVDTLRTLHNQKIIHRDIKLSNLFVVNNQDFKLLIQLSFRYY